MAVPLADLKLISKPKVFSGAREDWADWRFSVENYFSCVDIAYAQELDTGAGQPNAIDETMINATPELRARATLFFAAISQLVTGKPAQICRGQRHLRNGYEVWREVSNSSPVAASVPV